MFLTFLVLAVVLSILVSAKLCAEASGERIFRGLFWSLAMSTGFAGLLFLRSLTGQEQLSIWALISSLYRHGLYTFPMAFLVLYWILTALRRDQSSQPSVSAQVTSVIMLSFMFGLIITGLYASRIEPYRIEVTHTELKTEHLKAGSPELKIVQLSDLHIDEFGRREKRALEIVKDLEPDIIVLTGDYTNDWEKAPDVKRFMESLSARYGVYAVHGNWNPGPRARVFFEGTDIRIVEGRSEIVRTESGRVVIAGIPWHMYHTPDYALRDAQLRDSFVILLSHKPEAGLHVSKSVDLVLAGHTHGGQVRLPFIGPLIILSGIDRDAAAGLSKTPSGGWLYVNRGLGMEGGRAPRIRLLCRPEISVFHIQPKDD